MATKAYTLSDLLAELDEHADGLVLEDLVGRLRGATIGVEDLRPYIHFGRESYQRNLLHEGSAYHALVICWRAGQRSPIHDHRGSSCGVRVMEGVATETGFERTADGLIYPTSTRSLETGAVCGSYDDGIHQISNLQPAGRNLVTLHIYSPPLLQMGMYSLTDSLVKDFNDPIVGFADGAGI